MGKVLHGAGSGYFPFCIQKADSVPTNASGGTYYPVALSLNLVTALFWRVKKWTFADAFLGETSPPCSMVGAPLSEEGLVCASAFSYADIFYGAAPGAESQMDFRMFTSSPRVLLVGNEYYPRLFFSGQYEDDTGFFANGLSLRDTGQPNLSGIFRINLIDTVISMDLYSELSEINFYIADLTANEYWSYGGTYNTQTGAPL